MEMIMSSNQAMIGGDAIIRASSSFIIVMAMTFLSKHSMTAADIARRLALAITRLKSQRSGDK